MRQCQAVLQHRHHAQAEEIDLDDAEILAIVLVPLHHRAARHGGIFQRHDLVEPALADDHAAGMLPEMARQAVDAVIELDQRPKARMRPRDARLDHLFLQFQRVLEIAAGEKIGKALAAHPRRS